MNKPIYAALGSFVGLCGTTHLVTYNKHNDTAWLEAIGGGFAAAYCMFIVAQWKLDREKKEDNSSSE